MCVRSLADHIGKITSFRNISGPHVTRNTQDAKPVWKSQKLIAAALSKEELAITEEWEEQISRATTFIFKRRKIYSISLRDLPGDLVVKNPPANAGDVDSGSSWGIKIPHALGQLSLSATTTEPTCCKERSV